MAEVKIYIDSKIADVTPEGVNLVLTYSVKSKEGFEANTGTRSEYSFELPCTKRNDEIFQRFYDVSEVTGSRQTFLDARIEIDGMTFFTGRCQLQSVALINDFHYWKGDSYKVAFYGNNVDWIVQLKDKYLNQYDFGQHTYNRNDIIGHWGNIYSMDNYKYILIKWKDWAVVGQVDPLESTPALFIRTIVEKIFAGIGYTINSTFMTSSWFSKLVLPIPLPDKYGNDFSDAYLTIEAEDNVISDSIGGVGVYICPTQTFSPTVGANPYNNITGTYTAPYQGYYLCEFSVSITNLTGGNGTTGFAFGFSINGAAIVFPTWGATALSPIQPYTTDTEIKGEYVFLLAAGDTVEVAGIWGGGGTSVDRTAFFRVTGEADIIDGALIDFRYIINKTWKSIDLLKGIAHAFNLVFETNTNTRVVTIEPSDQYLYEDKNGFTRQLNAGFYNVGLSDTIEKTFAVDLKKVGEVESYTEISSKLRLGWKEDSADPTVESLNEANGDELNLFEAKFDYTANRFKEDEDSIENPFFAASALIFDSEILPAVFTKTPLIPIIWKENYFEISTSAEKNINVLPRIFVSEIPNATWNGEINVFDGVNVVTYPCPHAYMIDYNDTDGYQTSLSFSNHTNINGQFIKGLMERFYLNRLIRTQTGKRLQVAMFWDAILLQNLTFRDKIRIHGDEYILQEVNSFNVGKRDSTKTYLLYDAKGIGTEQNQIVNSTVNGAITLS
jgi:hypothetical protein